MTNQLSVIVGVFAGVVVGVVIGVVTRVGVELRLRLWMLCLHLHVVLWCFSSPGVSTPSDGALQRHPHTLTALRTESGVKDERRR